MGRFGGLFGQAFLAFWCTAVSGQLDSCVQIEIVFFEFVCPCDEESELYFSMTASSLCQATDVAVTIELNGIIMDGFLDPWVTGAEITPIDDTAVVFQVPSLGSVPTLFGLEFLTCGATEGADIVASWSYSDSEGNAVDAGPVEGAGLVPSCGSSPSPTPAPTFFLPYLSPSPVTPATPAPITPKPDPTSGPATPEKTPSPITPSVFLPVPTPIPVTPPTKAPTIPPVVEPDPTRSPVTPATPGPNTPIMEPDPTPSPARPPTKAPAIPTIEPAPTPTPSPAGGSPTSAPATPELSTPSTPGPPATAPVSGVSPVPGDSSTSATPSPTLASGIAPTQGSESASPAPGASIPPGSGGGPVPGDSSTVPILSPDGSPAPTFVGILAPGQGATPGPVTGLRTAPPGLTTAPSPSSLTETAGAESDSFYSTPTFLGVACAVVAAVLVSVVACLLARRRQTAAKKRAYPRAPPPGSHGGGGGGGKNRHRALVPRADFGAVEGGASSNARRSLPMPISSEEVGRFDSSSAAPIQQKNQNPAAVAAEPPRAGLPDGLSRGSYMGDVHHNSSSSTGGRVLRDTTSTADFSTGGRAAFPSADYTADDSKADVGGDTPATKHGAGSSGSVGVGRAVLEAAQQLAHHCQIPGVSEAATLVSILVDLLVNSRSIGGGSESSLKRCHSIVIMLKRAAKVLGKGGSTSKEAERILMGDVHDAIADLVQLIKTYQSKNKISRVLLSSLFRRRQEELDACVDRAISRLHLGLQVQAGQKLNEVGDDVKRAMRNHSEMSKKSSSSAANSDEALAAARRARRERNREQLEIPADHLEVTNELLGKGSFGAVYLADYNGRNAAVKVLQINHDLGGLVGDGESSVLEGPSERKSQARMEKETDNTQRKAFLRELEAMRRLRSPHTVNVYGAVTSLADRLILVMELLVGGDLRTLLKNAEGPLPEEQCRRIIGDVCAGMSFLHSRKTVHGDLKSANVLLDGAGRAKIGDFGTTRWTQHTNSTGLATYTTKSSPNAQMTLAWSAPEVLDAKTSTYASDVYSFAIVAWEVLSRELPWATETHPRDIYIRVFLKGLRPEIPADAPADMADIIQTCWTGVPDARPKFADVLQSMKENGWND